MGINRTVEYIQVRAIQADAYIKKTFAALIDKNIDFDLPGVFRHERKKGCQLSCCQLDMIGKNFFDFASVFVFGHFCVGRKSARTEITSIQVA